MNAGCHVPRMHKDMCSGGASDWDLSASEASQHSQETCSGLLGATPLETVTLPSLFPFALLHEISCSKHLPTLHCHEDPTSDCNICVSCPILPQVNEAHNLPKMHPSDTTTRPITTCWLSEGLRVATGRGRDRGAWNTLFGILCVTEVWTTSGKSTPRFDAPLDICPERSDFCFASCTSSYSLQRHQAVPASRGWKNAQRPCRSRRQ